MKNIAIFLSLASILMGCDRNVDPIVETSNYIERIPEYVELNEIKGEEYSDSMVEVIVADIMSANKPIEVDTFSDLHSFDEDKFSGYNCTVFDLELTKRLMIIDHPVSRAQGELLGVTDYLCEKISPEGFRTYVFYADSNESHYSSSVLLITVSEDSNKFNKLLLCQEYGKENFSYKIESEFLSKSQVVVRKTEYYGMESSVVSDDSTSVTERVYNISNTGNIEQQI
jgi:hypothetical protein